MCFGTKHYIASSVAVINIFCSAGFIAFIISIAVFILLALIGVPVHIVYHKFLALAVTSIVFSYILALFLYFKSLRAESSALAEGGNTGKNFCLVLMMYYCRFLSVNFLLCLLTTIMFIFRVLGCCMCY